MNLKTRTFAEIELECALGLTRDADLVGRVVASIYREAIASGAAVCGLRIDATGVVVKVAVGAPSTGRPGTAATKLDNLRTRLEIAARSVPGLGDLMKPQDGGAEAAS